MSGKVRAIDINSFDFSTILFATRVFRPCHSKELSQAVSLLFTTRAGRLISVAAKGLKTIVSTDHPHTLERLEKVAAG